MKPDDKEFLNDMITQLDETLKKLVVEEEKVTHKIGVERVEELKEFWKQDLSEDEERFFRMTLDYCDKTLISIWARTKRLRHTRAQAGQTFMKSCVVIGKKSDVSL
ncbi:MAG: hypothetical protein PHN45_04075 [Methylococcales bacterium]|nr:hypothetical protein [Methylococcales bacterium]MDD5753914.1 hypothetical protein [Methylococcales bacterium]